MNYLSVENLAKSYHDEPLFSGISFGLSQGQKTGVVGINGCGKSTILKILAGIEVPDSGNVVFRKGLKVAYLDQIPSLPQEKSVLEAIFNSQDNHKMGLIKAYEYEISQAEMGKANEEKLQSLIEEIDAHNAWDYEAMVKQILGKLGINDFNQVMSNLSGGQQKRVALAAVLIEKPDLLIIDEPTNHLDIHTIDWLENYLVNQHLTLLVVTHDRYFLDKVTNDIIELNAGKLYRYQGNYSYFLEKKLEREVMEKVEMQKAQQLMKKELVWMRRQPQARGTKAKYRIDAFHDLKEKVSNKQTSNELDFNIKTSRQGGKVLELKEIGKGYDGLQLVNNFSYTFKKGDRIGIIGKNGVGKSTFLDLLTGKIVPDYGHIDKGQTTKIGYYTQNNLQFEKEQLVLDAVKEVAEVIELADGNSVSASQFLNLFQFPPEVQYKPIAKLSGGEKRRLQLMRVLMQNPNFLLLDEPTNDLDLQTLNILESFLMGFKGCLLLVSHDRYFMDKLVDHSFIFKGDGQIDDFPGNYSDYRLKLEEEEKAANTNARTPLKKEKKKADTTEKTKLTFKEQQEYERLTDEIDQLEVEKDSLVEKMNHVGLDHTELSDLGNKVGLLEREIEDKTNRWLYLADFVS